MKKRRRAIELAGSDAKGDPGTYAQAGERLNVSAHTIATHVKKAYRKLGVH